METLEEQIKDTEKIIREGNIHGMYLIRLEELTLQNQLVIMKALKQLDIDLKAR